MHLPFCLSSLDVNLAQKISINVCQHFQVAGLGQVSTCNKISRIRAQVQVPSRGFHGTQPTCPYHFIQNGHVRQIFDEGAICPHGPCISRNVRLKMEPTNA